MNSIINGVVTVPNGCSLRQEKRDNKKKNTKNGEEGCALVKFLKGVIVKQLQDGNEREMARSIRVFIFFESLKAHKPTISFQVAICRPLSFSFLLAVVRTHPFLLESFCL